MKALKRQLVVYFVCLAIFLQVIPAWGIGSDGESVHLVILHVNDTHGRLLPYDTGEAKSIGGIARMATRIKEIRRANEGRTLVLHAGDALSRGDSLTVYYGGEVNMLAMEAVGYDAFTPGNGDFYFGVPNLVRQMGLVKFPVLLANVFYRENGRRIFQPYVIKELAGVRTAILGLGFIRESHPSGWPLELRDPVTVAKEYVPILRDKADLVIALTHIGHGEDKRLAAEVPQIDIIVGGHSHTRLDIPVRIPRKEGKGEVIVAQAGDYRKFLGRLDLYLQSDGSGKYHLTNVEGKLLPIDSSIKEDEEIAGLLERHSVPLSEVICTSRVTLESPDKGDSPLGNLVAEALRVNTGADAALIDRGSVQGEITPGEVTVADVGRIHAWRNRVLELTLTGAELQKLLTEQDILTSGLSYSEVDGEIKDLKVGPSPVELSRKYRVVTAEFLLASAPSLREVPSTDTGQRVDNILLKYLEQIAVIEGPR